MARRRRRGLFAWIGSLFSLERAERRYDRAQRSFLDSDSWDWHWGRGSKNGQGGRASWRTYRKARRANRLSRVVSRRRRRRG